MRRGANRPPSCSLTRRIEWLSADSIVSAKLFPTMCCQRLFANSDCGIIQEQPDDDRITRNKPSKHFFSSSMKQTFGRGATSGNLGSLLPLDQSQHARPSGSSARQGRPKADVQPLITILQSQPALRTLAARAEPPIRRLIASRAKPFRLATVAMANKAARAVWAILTKKQEYRQTAY